MLHLKSGLLKHALLLKGYRAASGYDQIDMWDPARIRKTRNTPVVPGHHLELTLAVPNKAPPFFIPKALLPGQI